MKGRVCSNPFSRLQSPDRSIHQEFQGYNDISNERLSGGVQDAERSIVYEKQFGFVGPGSCLLHSPSDHILF